MGTRLRAPAALAAGALGVHQLRYLAGHGDRAADALAREGHAYLSLAAPLVALLGALALGQFVLALQRRAGPGRRVALRRLWPLAAVSLVAVYVVQESLEGALLAGHPGGVAGLVGAGGWTALPLAAALGLAIALLLRGADALLAARNCRGLGFGPPGDAHTPASRVELGRRGSLARHLAGRSPPSPSF